MYWLRKIALTLLVLGLSSAIFFLMISDKQTKKEILKPTLEALGTQLFAAVQDDSQKEELEKSYQVFMQKAEAEEIPPAAVEEVAAQILNLSNRDSLISAKDAMALLITETPEVVVNIAPPPPDPLKGTTGWPVIRDQRLKILPQAKVSKVFSQKDLADRLRSMQEFQKEMQHLSRSSGKQHLVRQKYYFSQTDSGLTVRVDATLRDALSLQDTLMWRKFAEMEKKRWLEWEQKQRKRDFNQQMSDDSLRKIIQAAETMALWARDITRTFTDSMTYSTDHHNQSTTAVTDEPVRMPAPQKTP